MNCQFTLAFLRSNSEEHSNIPATDLGVGGSAPGRDELASKLQTCFKQSNFVISHRFVVLNKFSLNWLTCTYAVVIACAESDCRDELAELS